MDYQQMVLEFHQKYGHAVSAHPTIKPGPGVQSLRLALMHEELGELSLAVAQQDLIEIADGLADLMYVVVGTAVSYGIPLDEVFAEVHRSNMTKAVPPAKAIHEKYPENFNPKGSGYSPPDIAGVLYQALKDATDASQGTSEASKT